MVLMSGYPRLLESAPLSSYRYGNEVSVWRYTEALAALHQVEARLSQRSWPPLITYRCSRKAGGRRGGVAKRDPERT